MNYKPNKTLSRPSWEVEEEKRKEEEKREKERKLRQSSTPHAFQSPKSERKLHKYVSQAKKVEEGINYSMINWASVFFYMLDKHNNQVPMRGVRYSFKDLDYKFNQQMYLEGTTDGTGRVEYQPSQELEMYRLHYGYSFLKQDIDEYCSQMSFVREHYDIELKNYLTSELPLRILGRLVERIDVDAFYALMGGVFGYDVPPQAYAKLYDDIKQRKLSYPKVQVITDDECFYHNQDNKVRIGITFIDRALYTKEASEKTTHQCHLAGLLVHEFGHHLDYVLRNEYSQVGGDAPLDEGANFAFLLSQLENCYDSTKQPALYYSGALGHYHIFLTPQELKQTLSEHQYFIEMDKKSADGVEEHAPQAAGYIIVEGIKISALHAARYLTKEGLLGVLASTGLISSIAKKDELQRPLFSYQSGTLQVHRYGHTFDKGTVYRDAQSGAQTSVLHYTDNRTVTLTEVLGIVVDNSNVYRFNHHAPIETIVAQKEGDEYVAYLEEGVRLAWSDNKDLDQPLYRAPNLPDVNEDNTEPQGDVELKDYVIVFEQTKHQITSHLIHVTLTRAKAKEEDVDPLEVGLYKDLMARSVKDGMDIDHIPSHKALCEVHKRNLEIDLLLTEEERLIKNNGVCVVIPTWVHRGYSETYGGRNIKQQWIDIQNLIVATNSNFNAIDYALQRLYSPSDRARAKLQLHRLNEEMGWYDSWLPESMGETTEGLKPKPPKIK